MDTSKRLPSDRENVFPSLFANGYAVMSEEDFQYNCIAWAAGDENTQNWWTPFSLGHGYYWPEGLPKRADLDTFAKLYEICGGYTGCETGELESGFEKIALDVGNDGEVTHAARQIPDGTWTSKLGEWEDINHRAPESLCGPDYGTVAKFLKRDRTA